MNTEVNPSQIILKDELNKIGLFKVEINFHFRVCNFNIVKIDQNTIKITSFTLN